MDILGEGGDTRGEGGWVGLDVLAGVALGGPAVVQVQVVVASSQKALSHYCVGCLPNQSLVDFASELIPAVPGHRRNKADSVIQAGHNTQQGEHKEINLQKFHVYECKSILDWLRVNQST